MNKTFKLICLNIILLTVIFIIPNKNFIQNTTESLASNIIQEEQKPVEIVSSRGTTVRESKDLNIDFEMNLLTPSNLSENELEEAFVNTDMVGLSQNFITAENETGINAIYLSGLACHESAWGTSNFAKTRNNIFGWQSYDSNLNATKYFESKEQSIIYVANKLKANYLSENGCYFSGYTISSISKRYATDKQHATKVFNIMKKIIEKIQK